MAKKFENIFIASDLDGTYFNMKTQIVERNVERVKYFCENGGHFTFATGRLPLFIRKPIPNPKELVNFAGIMGNGTCLYDFSEERAIEEHFLDVKYLIEVEDFLRKLTGTDAAVRATYDKGIVLSTLENAALKREFDTFPDYVERHVCSAKEWGGFNLYKANIRGSAEAIAAAYSYVEKEFSDVLAITTSCSTMIELMPLGTSKAEMLLHVKEKYFDNKVTLCTVGDYDNDVAMHSVSDFPVCPSNANDKVKSICKLQLCSNDDGVIGDLIDYLDRNV